MKKKLFVTVIICMFLFPSFNVITTTSHELENNSRINKFVNLKMGNGETEYWAVLIGVGMGSENQHPDNCVERNIKYMHKTLIASDFWKTDHIKVITEKNATALNIIKALRWLDRMDDGNDVSLVYYSGHGDYLHLENERLGFEIPIDLPPFDEKDRCDEIITTYGYDKKLFAFITDDLFNFLLNRLDSQGVAVIYDSCYSGGMSDSDHNEDNNRVTLMSSRENERGGASWWRLFGSFVSEGLQGYADSNEDGMVTAEEAFAYASPKYPPFCYCVPTIDDQYSGELILTRTELPPSLPNLESCNTVGKTSTIFNFYAQSTDPEDHKIRYGWNWRNDSVNDWHNVWGGNVEEWSDYYNSNEICNMVHLWDTPGVYTVRVKAQDEYGAEIIPDDNDTGLWTKPLYMLIHSDDEIVDQYQLASTNTTYDIYMDCTNYTGYILVNHSNSISINQSIAQSFIPTKGNLSKIKIKFTPHCPNDMYMDEKERYPVNISIRENLDGEDLIKISKKLSTELIVPDSFTPSIPSTIASLYYTFYCRWVEFNFHDLNIIPGKKYYIVVSCDSPNYLYGWCRTLSDSYQKGEAFYNNDSQNWLCNLDTDMCFITYE